MPPFWWCQNGGFYRSGFATNFTLRQGARAACLMGFFGGQGLPNPLPQSSGRIAGNRQGLKAGNRWCRKSGMPVFNGVLGDDHSWIGGHVHVG